MKNFHYFGKVDLSVEKVRSKIDSEKTCYSIKYLALFLD